MQAVPTSRDLRRNQPEDARERLLQFKIAERIQGARLGVWPIQFRVRFTDSRPASLFLGGRAAVNLAPVALGRRSRQWGWGSERTGPSGDAFAAIVPMVASCCASHFSVSRMG